MTELRLERLGKSFGDVHAVRDIDLVVPSGRMIALLGPSGCGKTTTLRMIAGLETPTSGAIRFDGLDVLAVPPERRDIGMVFQRYVLFPHMTVERNVSFGLRMRGMNRREIAAKVDAILETVQLGALRGRFPSQLSGGQQQRVAIARTLVTGPRLLLMDEPLSNLDAKLRTEMRAFIRELQRRFAITTVFVTHDQVEAMELADTVGVMFDGALVQFDAPHAIFNRPATPRVAEFMGAANFIEGRVGDAASGRTCIDTALGPLFTTAPVTAARGAAVHMTIRPEHCVLRLDSADGGLGGEVTGAVYFGGTLVYDIAVGSSSLKVQELSRRQLPVGARVQVELPAEHLWVFPEPSPSLDQLEMPMSTGRET